jgi:ATP synthase F1 delta subunit
MKEKKSKVYASALYRSLGEDKGSDGAKFIKELELVDEALALSSSIIVEDPNILPALNSSLYSLPERIAAANEIFSRCILNRLSSKLSVSSEKKVMNFFLLIVELRRLDILKMIESEFFEILQNLKKSLTFEIVTAFDIDEDEKNSIAATVKKSFSQASLSWAVDRGMLGGMKVISGDKVYDASLKASLDKLTEMLSRNLA